jgi:hypothetical protein
MGFMNILSRDKKIDVIAALCGRATHLTRVICSDGGANV